MKSDSAIILAASLCLVLGFATQRSPNKAAPVSRVIKRSRALHQGPAEQQTDRQAGRRSPRE